MRRFLGIVGMVLAVIGILLCLGTTFGSWYGRYAASTAVAEAIPKLDNLITTQTDFLRDLDLKLDRANADISGTRTRINAVVDESASGVRTVVDALSGTVNTVLAPVRTFRTNLAAIRGSMMLFATALNGLPSFLNLPTVPTEGLEALDARASELDERVAGAEQTITTTRLTLTETRAQARATLDVLQSGITSVRESLVSVTARLREFQNGLPALQPRVNFAGTSLALLLSLAALCGIALFVQLFHAALLQWRIGGLDRVKNYTTTTTTETRTEKVDNGERTITTVTVAESKVITRAAEPAP